MKFSQVSFVGRPQGKPIGATLLCFALFVSFSLRAENSQAKLRKNENLQKHAALKKKIDAVLRRPEVRRGDIGVYIRSLSRNETLYEHKSHKPINPASNIKIVTTLTALKKLGVHYRFQTGFYTNKQFSDGGIENLYVKGGGDPFLVKERLWRIAGDLRNRDLTSVRGNIIIDGSFFDNNPYPPGWPENPGHQAYFAPTAAFAVNFNTVAVHVRPGKKQGDAPKVTLDPDVKVVKLRVDAQTTRAFSQNRLKKEKKKLIISRISSDGGDYIQVSGLMPLNAKPMLKYRNITKPHYYAGEVLRDILKNQGISVSGTIRMGRVPENAIELFVEKSPPLGTLIKYVNKLSNNFMTEQILKTLAAEHYGPPGNTRKGVDLLEKFLKSLDIPSREFELENGSGLSRKTSISPYALVRVLEEGYKDPVYRPEFISSLALGGLDGTLEERLEDFAPFPRVRAKTGSLDGVSCITGYLFRKDGEIFAYSILMNKLGKGYAPFHRIQDEIIGILNQYNG